LETRLRRVEDLTIEMKNDYKLVIQTQKSISETLRELKTIIDKLHSVEKHLIKEDNQIDTLATQTKVLFKFKEETELRLRKLETSDSVQGIKLGGGEKFFWIGVTAMVGIVVAVFKGGAQ